MTPVFPPQFFILLGIDIFLGASLITVMFDEEFPTGLPYMIDFGALVGFMQLVLGPQYLSGYPSELQFYLSAAYSVMAVVTVIGCNVYVAVARHRVLLGGVFAFTASLPSVFVLGYFVAAYVNQVLVPLPLLPLLPMPVVWGAFLGATGIIATAMVVVVRTKRTTFST